MKNILLLALAVFAFACGGSPEGEKAEASEAVETAEATTTSTTVAVDPDASIINWVGAKFTGDQHTGTINIKDGNLLMEDGQLVGGSFVIDITSMANTDLPDDETKAKLVGHLTSGDFFEVEKFPTATFEIAEVSEITEKENDGLTHNITGNLTMKDITKSITFPAKVVLDGGALAAKTPQFTIDRTEWGVVYGSTLAGVAKDKAIDENIGLSISLSTK